MKVFFTLALLAALGLLWSDDNARRGDLAQGETRAAAAEQKAQAESQQVGQLTAQVSQLQSQLNRGSNSPVARSMSAAAPTPAPESEWFQQRLNGAPTVVDPGYNKATKH